MGERKKEKKDQRREKEEKINQRNIKKEKERRKRSKENWRTKLGCQRKGRRAEITIHELKKGN